MASNMVTSNNSSDGQSLIENTYFKFVFDLPTPRPHIIILFKNKGQKCDVSSLSENLIASILSLVQEFVQVYSISDNGLILSFHTGAWIDTEEFHGHLCFSNTQTYIDLFKRINLNIENFKPTKQWLNNASYSSKKEHYLKSVAYFDQKCKDKYLKSDIANINKNRATTVRSPISAEFPFESTNFRIAFMIDEPVLKFTAGTTPIKLYRAMIRFAYEHGYFDKNTGKGSHICLNLTNNYSSEESSGFIRLSADEAYRIHPQPDAFLRNLSTNNNYFIRT